MKNFIKSIINTHFDHYLDDKAEVESANQVNDVLQKFILWLVFDDYSHSPSAVKGIWEDDKYFLDSDSNRNLDELFDFWYKNIYID